MATPPTPTSTSADEFGSASALRAPAEAVDNELTELKVNLTPRSVEALHETAARLGDTRTDTVNRALQLYANLTALEVGQGFTYQVREGEPVTIARIKTPRAARRAIQEGS